MTHRVTTPLKEGTINLIAEVLLGCTKGFYFFVLTDTLHRDERGARFFVMQTGSRNVHATLSEILLVNSPNINCTLVDTKLVSMSIFVQFLSF